MLVQLTAKALFVHRAQAERPIARCVRRSASCSRPDVLESARMTCSVSSSALCCNINTRRSILPVRGVGRAWRGKATAHQGVCGAHLTGRSLDCRMTASRVCRPVNPRSHRTRNRRERSERRADLALSRHPCARRCTTRLSPIDRALVRQGGLLCFSKLLLELGDTRLERLDPLLEMGHFLIQRRLIFLCLFWHDTSSR